jgi:hypothetical protein
MSPEPISFDDARRAGMPRFRGRPCVHHGEVERWTKDKHCCLCYPVKTAEQRREKAKREAEAEERRVLHLYENVTVTRVSQIGGWQMRMLDTPSAKVRNRHLNRVLAERTQARLQEIKQGASS